MGIGGFLCWKGILMTQVTQAKQSRGFLYVVRVTLMVIVTTVLLIAACIGAIYWGILHMNDKSDAQTHQVETATTVAIKNYFANIKTVEVHHTSYNAMIGTYAVDVTMVNTRGIIMRYTTDHSPSEPNVVDGWDVEDEKGQREGKTTTPVHVTYSDGTRGEV